MKLIAPLLRIWTGSIRRRLMLSMCGLIAVVMTTFVYQTVEHQRRFLLQQNEERCMALAETLAATSSTWVLTNDIVGLGEVVESALNHPDLRYIMVLKTDGQVLAHSTPYLVGYYATDRSTLAMLASPRQTREVGGPPSAIHMAAPIRSSNRVIGWVRIGMGQERGTETLKVITQQGLLFTALAVILAALLVAAVGRGLVKGLNGLVAMTQRVAAGETTARAAMRRDDELGALSNAFDIMAASLETTDRTMRANEQELRQVLTNLPVPILMRMPDGVISYANAAARKALNIRAEELQNEPLFFPHWRFIHANGTTMPAEEIPVIHAMRTKQPVSGHMLGIIPQGATEPRWLHLNAYPDLDSEGNVRRVVVAFLDVTELRRAEESLRQLSAAVEQSPVSVFITDTAGSIRYVNPAFCTFTGFAQEEVIGRNPRILNGGDTPAEEYGALWQTIKGGEVWHGTLRNKRKDGTRIWAETIIAPIRSTEGAITQFVCIQQDITARKEAEERVEFLAHHDTLTGLPNRLMGKERMQWAMKQADRTKGKAALMFLDLDGFKRINDTLGHGTGDRLLKEVSERLQSCMRRTDTIARQGGDEFLIMLTGIRERDDTITPADTILEHLARPYHIDGHDLNISGSLGIAVYPDDGADWETLLKKADTAMYAAKESGRNTYRFFAEHMTTSVAEIPQIRNQKPNALLRGEFVLHYQPRIDLKSGLIAGFTTQLLWNSPDLGAVPPETCVPFGQHSALAVPVGAWALREACRHGATWQTPRGSQVNVAVGIPPALLRGNAALATVIQALAESGLNPACLELEIPETVLTADSAEIMAAVGQIKALGVMLTASASTTSFAGLANLKKVKPDKIKIEAAEMRGLLNGNSASSILAALMQTARSLGMTTVVEGVDDENTLHVIQQHDCDQAQGLYYAPAMPFETTATFLQEFVARQPAAEPLRDAIKHA